MESGHPQQSPQDQQNQSPAQHPAQAAIIAIDKSHRELMRTYHLVKTHREHMIANIPVNRDVERIQQVINASFVQFQTDMMAEADQLYRDLSTQTRLLLQELDQWDSLGTS